MVRRLTLAAALVGISISAQAALISGVTATTSMGTWVTYGIAHLTDGSGLSAPESFSSTAGTDYRDMWLSNGSTAGTVVFDLGKDSQLTGIAIWQYNLPGLLGRGVKTYSLDISTDGVTYTPLQGPAQLPIGSGEAGLPATIVGVPVNIYAHYVRMNIAGIWGADSYAGLSEVQFSTPDPVGIPEPATISAMLMGSALVLRRKRQQKA